MHLCSACRRHLKLAPCPFCGEALASATPPPAAPGLARAQVLATVALAGALVVGCTEKPTTPAASSSSGGNETVMTVYGAPPDVPDAGPLATPDAGPAKTSQPPAPAYGAPPPMPSVR